MSTDYFSGRFSVHGHAVELTSHCPRYAPDLQHLLAPFAESDWPEGFAATSGTLHPYDQADVLRHLSPTAKLVESAMGWMELYEDGERFWLVDDRWGICEINILKSQWRSWILPEPQIDSFQCAETSVLWPMAQLLRHKGLHLAPAASVAFDGWSGLLISRGSIDRELEALAEAGFSVIGQRWTAMREEDGRVSILHVPGRVEHTPDRRRFASEHDAIPRWINLHEQHPESFQHHAFCDAVLMIEPGRRPRGKMSEASPVNAIHALRRCWPIVELHPTRRTGAFSAKMAQCCRCYEIQLSRDPKDLVHMLHAAQGLELTPWASTTEPTPAPSSFKTHSHINRMMPDLSWPIAKAS
jgi:hypothetical protein